MGRLFRLQLGLGVVAAQLALVDLRVAALLPVRDVFLHDRELVGHAARALEEAGVDVEDVTGIRLTTGRPAQQERQLAIGDGLLRQIVVDAERVAAAVAEVLGHRDARVRGDELERRRLARAGDDDRRVLHGAVLRELVDDGGHRGLLLPDGDVEAENPLTLLVEDRVDGDRGLAGLAVPDDELALAAPDGDHAVDALQARLERLAHRLPRQDARRLELDAPPVRRLDGALAVDRLPERVHDATHRRLAHRHVQNAAGPPDDGSLLDVRHVAEARRADVVRLEVEHEAHQLAGELDQLARHGALEPVDARDSVSDAEHRPCLGGEGSLVVVLNLLLDDRRDLFGPKLHGGRFPGRFGSGRVA